MYTIIIILLISLLLVFFIHKFYSKIDKYVKQFLPSQRVVTIKAIMKKLDNEQELSKKNYNLGK